MITSTNRIIYELKINSSVIFLSLLPVWYFKFEIYKIDIIFFSIFLIVFFSSLIYS